MASAFRSLLSTSARLSAPRLGRSVYPSTQQQSSKLATVTNARIFFRSKHIDYTQKYAEKLKRKAEEEGVASLDELKAKLLPATQTAFKKAQPKDSTTATTTTTTATAKTADQKDKDRANAASEKPYDSGSPSLDKIMKLNLVKDLSADDIGKIWIQKHMEQEDTISAVVPAETYKKMLSRAKEYPMFLLPLSHGDGVEFYLLQFAFHQVIFTSLLEYQTHLENARPFLTLTHYPELIDSKGIVLMKGVISTEPRLLTADQAQVLTFGLQQYYVSDHKEKLQLLHDFHKKPAQFSHEKLVALTEISG
ncbi:hypothetical protein BGZ79_002537 [Entomortierella chlamydospora]|nr:hypothetical protein BGZ79_002537 [Entomortierella chlamydospora]